LADLSRRLDGWARGVVGRLAELGVDAQAQPNDAGGAVQVRFVTRGTGVAESACLVLRIEATRVRAGLEVPGVQAGVARVRLLDPARALELATALEVLPEQFTMGASTDPVPVEALRATAADLRNLLERAGEPASVWVGWTVPRAFALEHAAMLDEQLEDAIAALAQLFAMFVTYASDLDERARSEGPRFAARRTDTKLLSRPPSRRRPLKAAEVVIERGARVRVLKGPFSGKVGVVQELDAKGGARVMLGLLAVRLEVTNLMPCVEGRGRPVLSSSHRKPIPARS